MFQVSFKMLYKIVLDIYKCIQVCGKDESTTLELQLKQMGILKYIYCRQNFKVHTAVQVLHDVILFTTEVH